MAHMQTSDKITNIRHLGVIVGQTVNYIWHNIKGVIFVIKIVPQMRQISKDATLDLHNRQAIRAKIVSILCNHGPRIYYVDFQRGNAL